MLGLASLLARGAAALTPDEVIIRSTIDLGHDLGLRVVVEGIESGPVLERLRPLGCDLGQGYCISRPLPGRPVRPVARHDRQRRVGV